MLNISNSSITDKVKRQEYSSLMLVESKLSKKVLRRIIFISFGLVVLVMFLPWTQNVRSNGTITTLEIDQRPQNVHSVIGGRIESWFVTEGDFAEAGDTIVQISEIKDDYLDPDLVVRTQNQLGFKEQSVTVYGGKVRAKGLQIEALSERRVLEKEQAIIKIKQSVLKVQSDSVAYLASRLNYSTAQAQYLRADSLYAKGFKSLVELESRRIKLQEREAQEIAAQNKYLESQNDLINSRIYLNNVLAKFRTDLAKLDSEKLAAISEKLTAEADVNKLSNELSNYKIRSGLYFITAPQQGYITKTIQNGIGETIKAGDKLVSISPSQYELAVETYIKPLDLPLMSKGQHVRLQFDGWPAIVFSGWPDVSHGTYGGEIYAIDQFISENGMYRVLVKPDETEYPWPSALRFGGGASNFMLLNNVPIWYELWRQINDFPADFYTHDLVQVKKDDKK
jgi:adhesin transport system membrane fusion protein